MTWTAANTHVAVLLGGLSSERDISRTSGVATANALTALGYRVTQVDVGRDLSEVLRELAPDVVFNALHGRYGEDGIVQGVLELLELPYTGCGVLASATASDKLTTKKLLRSCQIATPDWQEIHSPDDTITLPFPLVIKPNEGGSSIGIQRLTGPEQLASALPEAQAESARVFVEQTIVGRELTVAVLDGEALPVVEIVPDGDMFSFEAKYSDCGTRYLVPASLPDAVTQQVSDMALATYTELGCRGAARVDLMLDENDQPWVLEINTIPGLTPKSLLPMAAQAVGMDFQALIERILQGAS